jgi:hypothetical protein
MCKKQWPRWRGDDGDGGMSSGSQLRMRPRHGLCAPDYPLRQWRALA